MASSWTRLGPSVCDSSPLPHVSFLFPKPSAALELVPWLFHAHHGWNFRLYRVLG